MITIEETLNLIVYLIFISIILSGIYMLLDSAKIYQKSVVSWKHGEEIEYTINSHVNDYIIKKTEGESMPVSIAVGNGGKARIIGTNTSFVILPIGDACEPY